LSPRRTTDPTLDSLITKITVDCYDEAEQLTAFENAFDEDATSPALALSSARTSRSYL
jgi:hypothetical protein